MIQEVTPRPFALFSAALFALAVVLSMVSASLYPLRLSPVLAIMLLAVALSENFAFEIPGVGSNSLSYPLTIAGILLLGPTAGALLAVFSGANLRDIRAGRPLPVIAFNVSQLVISATSAGLAYVACGGLPLVPPSGSLSAAAPITAESLPSVLVPLAACAGVSLLANDLLVAAALHLLHGVAFREVWRTGLLWMIPTQATLALVGFTIAQVLAIQVFAFALFIFPLLVARQLYQSYVSLRGAYVDTIRSLVNILEAKDPYTRGHSERVARLARSIAEELGYESHRASQLESAAILHDIGKLTIPTNLLRKAGPLSDEERGLILAHPEVGAQIVGKVPYLRDLGETIICHHERVDGTGYAGGLAGAAIPLDARILAVADSYDAMTTARSYRPAMSSEDAVAELIRCAGQQFDSKVVDAFLNMGEPRRGAQFIVAGETAEGLVDA